MRTILATFALFASSAAFFPAAYAGASGTMFTGYVDELPGAQFVLRDTRDLTVKKYLEPGSFANEYFAQFLGYKVAINGRVSSRHGRPELTVPARNDIRRLCAGCDQR